MEKPIQKDGQKVSPLSGDVQRLEIVSGPTGRRRWSLREKARIVCESYRDGVSVSAVARRNGLRANQLFLWRQHARQGKLVLPGEAVDGLCLAPVVVAGGAEKPSARHSAASPTLEIESDGVVVRVGDDSAAERIGEIARALRTGR